MPIEAKGLTEEQLKQMMNIKDFRHMSKDKVLEVISTIQDMDPKVAAECIAQFPEFNSFANKMVENLLGLYNDAINSAKHFEEAAVESYKQILDNLTEELKSNDLPFEERRQISSDMIFVADKINEIAKDHQDFIGFVVKCGSFVATAAIALGAAILGVKIKDDHLLR